MKNKSLNALSYALIFSLFGLLVYVLLAVSTELPMDVERVITYAGGYLFFVTAFNLVGFATLRLSDWIGRYVMYRWKMGLLYACVALILLFINYGLLVIAKFLVGANEPFIFPNGGHRILLLLWLVNLIIVGLLIANHSARHTMRVQQEAARLQEENNKARYMALQNQLNPHFLFNSLNTLIAEIEYDPQNAILFTRNLSDAYRYVLQAQNKELVSLREELDFMQAYIFLHQVRLGHYIHVDIDIDPARLEAQIPPLTLQLLVENVIKHNIINAARPMSIYLCVMDDILTMSNTLSLKKKTGLPGTGLHNLSARCRLILGHDLSVECDEHLFTVKIPLLYD